MMRAMAVRNGETRSRAALALLAVTALVGVAGVLLTALAWHDLDPTDAYPNLGCAVAGILYATLGALIVRRVGNRIGWLLLGEGLSVAIMSATSAYAVVGLVTHPGALPGAKVIGLLAEWIFVPVVVGVAFLLLLFPTGRLPSRRWRPVAIVGLAVTAVSLVGFVVTPRMLALPAPGGVSLTYPNPFAIGSLSHGASTALVGTLSSLSLFGVFLLGASVVALAVRYRSGGVELRQQIKWVAFFGGAAVTALIVGVVADAVCGCTQPPVTVVANLSVPVIVLFGIPVAITIAILKHGLYEIDVIINRAVVYGLLAAVATAVYVVVVVGVGSLVGYGVDSPVLTTAVVVAVALAFQPLRRQAQKVANRLVYGERATPYQVLSDFAENVAGTLGFEEVLDRMVSVLAEGTGATRVDVWIRVGSELRPGAAWPRGAPAAHPVALPGGDELPAFETATRAVAVRQRQELLGALSLVKPPNEPLTVSEDKLVQDLASQAALVFRNARLTAELRAKIEELRASRRRLVETQNAERRKIERNLHDGAQQQLVALRVQLGLLDKLAADPERVHVMTAQLQDALQSALDDLRDLARGIYPPLLADQGLAVALDAQARKAAAPTTVESDGIGRYSEEIESAVYFCALEAMQNVAKYADAATTVVRLSQTDGQLVFEIQDDGKGFDPGTTSYGTGLQGMADRLDAIGGTLEITSAPARGTMVRGRIAVSRSPTSGSEGGAL
jgi:signal transduction histidine kinase